jgi:hypothetical protein
VSQRVYRPSLSERFRVYALAAIATGFGVMFLVMAAKGRQPVASLILALVCIASGAFLTAAFRSYAVILRDESIEVVDGPSRRRTFHRTELRGRRMKWGGLAFVVGDEVVHVAALTFVQWDEQLDQWVSSLPDLDALDRGP